MKFIYSFFAILFAVSLIGCDSADNAAEDTAATQTAAADDHDGHGHDHGDGGHPETLGQAVDQIQEMGDKITTAFAGGTPDDAHGELHSIGHLIESLPELAKKESVSEEQQASVVAATEVLMEAFGKFDDTLHGGEEANVEELSKEISAELEKLRTLP